MLNDIERIDTWYTVLAYWNICYTSRLRRIIIKVVGYMVVRAVAFEKARRFHYYYR